MATFRFRSEPSTYSYADPGRDKRTVRDGVSNPVARRHPGTVRGSKSVFIYHTADEKQAVELELARLPRPFLLAPSATHFKQLLKPAGA